MVDPDARERAVLDLLDRWPWNLGGVIIGGYAVIAYGPPRYSDDLDVVLPKSAAEQTRAWLKAEGFNLEKRSVPNPDNFEGQVERYELTPISIDLLTDAVRDRDAKVDVPEAWISRRSNRAKLVTLAGRTLGEVPIARPEALWVLKLQAGRPRDIADLFAIADTPFEAAEIVALFRSLATESLLAKLQAVEASLRSRKTYVDSLSRRQLGRPGDPKNVQRWTRFTSQVGGLVRAVEGHGDD